MDLGISTNPTPELYTIKVTGEIDISNADSLRNAIDLALEQPTEAVELDFAQVSYIDSTGIGVTRRFRSRRHNLCPQKGRAVWHMCVMRSDVLASGRYT